MKKLIIIAVLVVQGIALIALNYHFNKKAVVWATEPQLKAVNTLKGVGVANEINLALDGFFAQKSEEFESPQYSINEISNNADLAILELCVTGSKNNIMQKETHELWVMLSLPEPTVFINNASAMQDYDRLENGAN